MASFKRHDGRRANQLRPARLIPGFVRTADGSCLIELGGTRVICTASFARGLPPWREGTGQGWVTAEYGMLPASTASRKPRPLQRPDSRSVEIQRLIGRALRAVVRPDRLGENTVTIDCDVLEADGGTRTASITGAYVALALAFKARCPEGSSPASILDGAVAAVSVGLLDGTAVLDLDYQEDAAAAVDMNVAMTSRGRFVEVQATGEHGAFDERRLHEMLRLARTGIRQLLRLQRQALTSRGALA
jgi:ribonuclease PH